MRNSIARIMVILMIAVNFLPILSMGAPKEPRLPNEKVIAKSGMWYSEYLDFDGKSNLIVGYTGGMVEGSINDEDEQEEEHNVQIPTSYAEVTRFIGPMKFNISDKTLITGVYIPFEGTGIGPMELYIQDSRGNIYQGFEGTSDIIGGIGVSDDDGNFTASERNTSYFFAPLMDMILPAGDYTLVLDGNDIPMSTFLVKGMDYSAYEKYLEALMENTLEEEEITDEEYDPYVNFGEEELLELYELYIEDWEAGYVDQGIGTTADLLAPSFYFENEMSLDQIILNTYNQGQGSIPGIIYVLDELGNELFSLSAQGASLGDVPNGLWTATPNVLLPPGQYYLDMSNPMALNYEENGEPMFYIGASLPAPPMTDFTGTYKVWLDMYKTRTLMGPVSGGERSFYLEDYPLSVLDYGDTIELLGQYEGMPFSQICTVTERDVNGLTAQFSFAADLTNLPYKANIAAISEVTLKKEVNGRITIGMAGEGYYSRAASKEKGADENTYSLSLRGGRVKKELPPFVMAALRKAYGVGNIPGPNTPFEAGVGMLFPPLVGLVVSVILDLLKPKELVTELSIGEQAMKNANNSLGKGLIDEREADAWKKLADALGNSGGDPEDAVSIGDNEIVPGEASTGDAGGSYENEDYGNDYNNEDHGNEDYGQEEVSEDYSGQETSSNHNKEDSTQTEGYEEPIPDRPEEPETMVITTTHNGAQELIVRDPETGGWVHSESGNPFDLEKHQRESPGRFEEVRRQNEHNKELEQKGQTGMQQAMKEIDDRYEQEMATIQQEIDKRKLEQLKRDMEWLEYEREKANKQNNIGRIIGDSVVNIGDELVETAVVVGTGISNAASEAKRTIDDIRRDPSIIKKTIEDSIDDINKGYELAKQTAKKTVDQIVKNPEIIIETAVDLGKKTGKVVVNVGKAIINTVKDPKKAWEFIKSTTGIDDFEKSWDPNIPLVKRIGHVATGTIKLGTTIATAGKAGAAIKKGAGKLGSLVDDLVNIGGKSMAKKGAKITKGIKPALKIKSGLGYKTGKKLPNMDGITQKSKIIVQNTADDFGVQIHARPTTKNAKTWIDSGKAVPKAQDMKAKTLDVVDEILGGPKNTEGLVGYYKPKLPPKNVMRSLHPNTQKEIVKKYVERRREYHKLSKVMKQYEAQGKYKVIEGRVFDIKSKKYITGDLDGFDVTNFDGTPVRPSIKKQVMDKLGKTPDSNVMHEDLMSWVNEEKAAFDLKAKAKMINAAKEGEKGLTTFNPLNKPTSTYQTGAKIPVDKLDQVLKGDWSGIPDDEVEAIIELFRSSGMEVG
ncbi:hypothetical protein [Petrocella sp. FN5]|uniref:hypothetical protein n=1 Tax=Petrocella sp. FN5 TaxID=3032002 RepID=UPI0023DB74CC|nr:hypothetical protein [Petrocella sp. FN5]MDF1617200.1 hypothetical protein [Petrocella sp. FN5]